MEYYNTLQLTPNASPDKIKSAFRRLSFIYHPDKNPNSLAEYTKIVDAYKHLTSTNQIIPYIEVNKHIINDIYTTLTIELTSIYNDTSMPIKITRNITKQNHSIEEIETLYINIFSGIDTNEIITIKHKGNILDDNQGDIKVKIIIENNSIFKRDGIHLILNKEITLKEALCGFEFNFTHLNNEIYYIKNYNNIIYPTYQKILPQLGLKRNNIYGHLVISFTILFPKQLSEINKTKLQTIL